MNPYITLSNALDYVDLEVQRALLMIDDGERELRLIALENSQDILGWAQGQLQLEHKKAQSEFWIEDEPGFGASAWWV